MTKQLEKVLYVNLTDKITEITSRPDLFTNYLGGVGVASKLLLEECPENVIPHSPEAPIILATGPLAGIFPNMTKTVAMFRSPLTGNLGESYAGGDFSIALRSAEFGAVVIKGCSEEPVKLMVEMENPRVEDASSLWNCTPIEVKENIMKSSGRAARSVITIGRAGENCVSYASAIVDSYSHFGRLGLGAVMGSKKLKAFVICGTEERKICESSEFLELRNEIEHLINGAHVMKKYKNLGTAANVLPLNALRALPTKNFSKSTYDKADELSGENLARIILEKKTSCHSCSVACIHLGKLTPDGSSKHNGASPEAQLVPYNYQPIFSLGMNLDVSDPKAVLSLIGCCERLGMDTMMTGAVLGWATEAHEKGLVSMREMKDLKPEWGNVNTYVEIIENIANSTDEYYSTLAKGVDAAAERYGGKDFAVSLGKNSPAGYLTGYGHIVGTLVGAREAFAPE